MRKYLKEYINSIEERIRNYKDYDMERLLKEHMTKISFMQHERLIHLLVMILFALMFLICFGLYLINGGIGILVLTFLILSLLIPYIRHYYFLENTVQKMYVIYDEIKEKMT